MTKAGDETVDPMFDELVETKSSGDGKVTVKRYIIDEETLAEMEMQEASEVLVVAEKRWAKLEADPARDVCRRFDALEARSQADRKLWLLFTSGDRSVRSNRMYNEYRELLLRGGSTRADA